jgi:hypothetical protein
MCQKFDNKGELQEEVVCAKFAYTTQHVGRSHVNDCGKPDGRKRCDGESDCEFDK